jgi:hypothetical protein
MKTLKIASLVVVGAVLTVACGDSNSSMNPTAPSVVSAAMQADASGAEGGVSGPTGRGNNNGGGNGNGNGNGGDNGNRGDNGNGRGRGGNDQPSVPTPPTPSTNTTPPSNTTPTGPVVGRVQIEGVISEVGDNTLTVNERTVFVPEDVVIRHGNRTYDLADLRPGDRVHIRANRVASDDPPASGAASETVLVATEVKLQNPGDEDDDDDDDDDDDGEGTGTTPPSGGTRVNGKRGR